MGASAWMVIRWMWVYDHSTLVSVPTCISTLSTDLADPTMPNAPPPPRVSGEGRLIRYKLCGWVMVTNGVVMGVLLPLV